MNELGYDRTCVKLEINKQFRNQLRDKIIDNMNPDRVDIDTVIKYIANCAINELIELNQIANTLCDWNLVGLIIEHAIKRFTIE